MFINIPQFPQQPRHSVCPTCGTCPTCGAARAVPGVTQPPYWQYPYQVTYGGSMTKGNPNGLTINGQASGTTVN